MCVYTHAHKVGLIHIKNMRIYLISLHAYEAAYLSLKVSQRTPCDSETSEFRCNSNTNMAVIQTCEYFI
jgi:hypothetical protein